MNALRSREEQKKDKEKRREREGAAPSFRSRGCNLLYLLLAYRARCSTCSHLSGQCRAVPIRQWVWDTLECELQRRFLSYLEAS